MTSDIASQQHVGISYKELREQKASVQANASSPVLRQEPELFISVVAGDKDVFGNLMPDDAALAIHADGDRTVERVALGNFDAGIQDEAPVEHVLEHLRVAGFQPRDGRFDAS